MVKMMSSAQRIGRKPLVFKGIFDYAMRDIALQTHCIWWKRITKPGILESGSGDFGLRIFPIPPRPNPIAFWGLPGLTPLQNTSTWSSNRGSMAIEMRIAHATLCFRFFCFEKVRKNVDKNRS